MKHRTPFRRIGVAEAVAIVGTGKALLLDVRDANSYAAGHVAGARNMAFGNLGDIIGTTPKAQPVVIYCYHGNASQEYAQALSDFGFCDVTSVDGGYEAWFSHVQSQQSAAVLDPALSAWIASRGFPPDGLNATAENGMTPLMKACAEGLPDTAAALIAAGAALDIRNADGNTALWIACVGDHLHIIDALVDAGIALDSANDNGATALMYAASAGKAGVVERLLARGADPTPETLDGFSALDLASTIECLTLLRRATKEARAAAPV
ncbi:ankyrin repeat domain-containing protein [Xanthobacter aminoxidans]|uniref:Ankyrin repeat domain-containing protein n=1 Tax=Xanthobacter aminoxidans TaxID=186280 RepID=A0ABW6ZMQ0_9HYPH